MFGKMLCSLQFTYSRTLNHKRPRTMPHNRTTQHNSKWQCASSSKPFQIPFQRQDFTEDAMTYISSRVELQFVWKILWKRLKLTVGRYDSIILNDSFILVSITSVPSWVPTVPCLTTFTNQSNQINRGLSLPVCLFIRAYILSSDVKNNG